MLRILAPLVSIAVLITSCQGPGAPNRARNVVERAEMAVTRPILSGGVQVGSLAIYRRHGGGQPWVRLVRNTHGQDLGLVDTLGRVWRFTPHGDEEVVPEPDFLRALGSVLGVREGNLISLGPEEPLQPKDAPSP
ncbi:MAG: hypothetical protein ABGY29_05880 [bacterium]